MHGLSAGLEDDLFAVAHAVVELGGKHVARGRGELPEKGKFRDEPVAAPSELFGANEGGRERVDVVGDAHEAPIGGLHEVFHELRVVDQDDFAVNRGVHVFGLYPSSRVGQFVLAVHRAHVQH